MIQRRKYEKLHLRFCGILQYQVKTQNGNSKKKIKITKK